MTGKQRVVGTLLAGALLTGGLASVAFGGAGAASDTTKLTVTDNDFRKPNGTKRNPTITIQKDDSVKWSWASDNGNPHNVKFTSVPEGASKKGSKTQTTGDPFKKTFTKTGTYRYECTIHVESDGMKAKVIVEKD
jgi:plastocyanin